MLAMANGGALPADEDVVWSLNDFHKSNTYLKQKFDRFPPTVEDLQGVVDELRSNWINTTLEPTGMMEWTQQKFQVDIASNDFSLHSFRKENVGRVIEVAKRIWRCCKYTGMIDNDSQVAEALTAVFHAIRESSMFIENAVSLFWRLDASRTYKNIIDGTQIKHIFEDDDQNDTSFQVVLKHVLQEIDRADVRRWKDMCYTQIFTPEDDDGNSFPTQAWEELMTIEKFVYKSVPKETQPELWRKLTQPHHNAASVTKHLINGCEAEFIDVQVNRFLLSFKNGIYNTEEDMFWIYNESEQWAEQGARMTEYRRANGWGDEWTATPPSREDVTIKYIDQEFRFVITPETEETFHPLDIPTPEVDSVLATQDMNDETCIWVFIFLGRLFFPVNKFDRWQVVLFLKGVAGSGKSTLAQIMKYFFPRHLLGTLSSNIEQKFGLSAIYESLLAVCAEVREDFGLDQGDWQSCATGEEVSIAIKNQTATSKVWDTPMLLAGNEYPKNYINNSGSVSRRMMCVEFNNKVDLERSDPFLIDKMYGNADRFLRKAVRLYHEAHHMHGTSNIWMNGILPEQFKEFHRSMRAATDPLDAFLHSEHVQMGDASYYMTMEDFKRLFFEFLRSNGSKPMRWTEDLYRATFKDYKIRAERTSRDVGGYKQSALFVLGVRQAETEDDD